MIIEPMIVTDKIGRSIVLRNAEEDDAESLIKFMKITTGETPFLIREPDEFSLTIEQEKTFIKEQKDEGWVVDGWVSALWIDDEGNEHDDHVETEAVNRP